MLSILLSVFASVQRPIYYVEAANGLRCVQPYIPTPNPDSKIYPVTGGMELPVSEWLLLIAENWLRETERGLFDGDVWRDGKVDMWDFALISRFWVPIQVDCEPTLSDLLILLQGIEIWH